MKYQKFGSVYAVRIDRGEEVMASLLELEEKEKIRAAIVEGLGAADHVTFGVYDVERRQFDATQKDEPLEITSITGSMTRQDGKPYLHLHITVADRSGNAFGGHLNEARISGTCELFVTVLDGEIGRRKDDFSGTGLNVFDF